jgi:anthranilate synthase component 1
MDFQPTLDAAREIFKDVWDKDRPTLLPISITTPSDLLTPSAIFLKLSSGYACRF